MGGPGFFFFFYLSSIEKHYRAFSRGVGYPDSGFYYVPSDCSWRMDCGVGWKLGSQGGGVVGLGMRGSGGLDPGGGREMQRHGWISCECLDLHLARIRDKLEGFPRTDLRGASFS